MSAMHRCGSTCGSPLMTINVTAERPCILCGESGLIQNKCNARLTALSVGLPGEGCCARAHVIREFPR